MNRFLFLFISFVVLVGGKPELLLLKTYKDKNITSNEYYS